MTALVIMIAAFVTAPADMLVAKAQHRADCEWLHVEPRVIDVGHCEWLRFDGARETYASVRYSLEASR